MSISPFQRLVSNTGDVFLGTSRDQAAMNAANNIGDHPDAVARRVDPPTWPSLQKFDNDDSTQSFSPFGEVPNPNYIWDQPTSDGQTVAFAIASEQFTIPSGLTTSFSVFLNAFADNAMEAKIELFEEIGGSFVKAAPQPSGLGDFVFVAGDPNNPAVGLTINDPPFTFQDIRAYSTRFTTPISGAVRTFKIVVSFEATNYLQQPIYSSNPSSLNNPAGLQFLVDIYAVGPQFLYVANSGDSTVEIYNVTNPTTPVRVGQFSEELSNPRGLAIRGTTLYVANEGDNSLSIFDISQPDDPIFENMISNLDFPDPEPVFNHPTGLAIAENFLYVSNPPFDAVAIFDISNPSDPSFVQQVNGANLSGPTGLNTHPPDPITPMTLYAANSGDSTIEIYDITLPTDPVRVREFGAGELSGPSGLATTGTTLYAANSGDSTIEIYDITLPTDPIRVREFGAGEVSGPEGLAITGTTLYAANFTTSTVEIYDITLPIDPIRVREFGTGELSGPFGLAIFRALG